MLPNRLEVWAGPECSLVRVGDTYVDELELTGHAQRVEDLDRLAALGVAAVRYPVLWERRARTGDWSFSDERLARLRTLGVRPIVGLVHHGSGPPATSLLETSFVEGLASHARDVAERYPWVNDFTPVNEPLTTARFSALYGHWYPHARSDAAFVRAVLVQCAAVRAAMRAIREVTPEARLVQTEDLGTVFSTPRLAYQADFENDRRFLTIDLLCGRVDRDHPLREWLEGQGADRSLLDSFVGEPCPPEIIGVNHYVASDRFLDEHVAKYPAHVRGGNGVDAYADVEAVRVLGAGIPGHRALLDALWTRYARPLAITECHLGCTPEDRIRWLFEAWTACEEACAAGVDVRAVTVWSAFGAADWDSLLTAPRGRYEAGAFDVRGGAVRPTAIAGLTRDLASKGTSDHPLLADPGWWRCEERLIYPTFGARSAAPVPQARPVLVTGSAGTLGRAVVLAAEARRMSTVALARADLDVTDRDAVIAALETHRPWAVVNGAGYVRVDDAERDRAACIRTNVVGASVLAEACAERGIRLAAFSSDLVFDGHKSVPYVESDAVRPLNVYGESKALAERLVLARSSEALVVRTSAFFGPADTANFVRRALDTLRAGRRFRAATDIVISPTYVPDLADAVLTLLVDGACGVFHLATPGAVSWYELACIAARHAELPTTRLVGCHGVELALPARRPPYSALASTRSDLLRPLDETLAALFTTWSQTAAELARAG